MSINYYLGKSKSGDYLSNQFTVYGKSTRLSSYASVVYVPQDMWHLVLLHYHKIQMCVFEFRVC